MAVVWVAAEGLDQGSVFRASAEDSWPGKLCFMLHVRILMYSSNSSCAPPAFGYNEWPADTSASVDHADLECTYLSALAQVVSCYTLSVMTDNFVSLCPLTTLKICKDAENRPGQTACGLPQHVQPVRQLRIQTAFSCCGPLN